MTAALRVPKRKESKKFGLKRTRRPKVHCMLSGVVQVWDLPNRVKTTVNISFSEDFIIAVGRWMPLGLSPANPGFIRVFRKAREEPWSVYGGYLDQVSALELHLLWTTEAKPSWI